MRRLNALVYNNFFLRNLILILLFFIITPITIFISLFSISFISKTSYDNSPTADTNNIINKPESGVKVFAAFPASLPEISGQPEIADARPEILKIYLENYNSPLKDYAKFMVETSEKYELDYRLLTAIAQQESNLCKLIPSDSYNCWGWGIHSQGTLKFNSYPEAIEIVAQGIKQNYINKGYITLEEIMSKYTPLSEGSWAFGVDKFMTDMELPAN